MGGGDDGTALELDYGDGYIISINLLKIIGLYSYNG